MASGPATWDFLMDVVVNNMGVDWGLEKAAENLIFQTITKAFIADPALLIAGAFADGGVLGLDASIWVDYYSDPNTP